MDLPRPGQMVIPLREWRRFVTVADWWDRTHGQMAGVTPEPLDLIGDKAKVRNDTGADRRLGDVVGLGALLLDKPYTTPELWYAGETPAASHTVFGVALEPIKDGKIGAVRVAGMCLAYVNFTNTSDRGATPQIGQHVLQSETRVLYAVVTPPASAGEQLVPVLLSVLHCDPIT